MRILFVCSGNSKNGISAFIKSQGESLRENGVELEYFTIQGKGFFGYFRNIFILKKYLKTNKFDLIHAHYSLTAFVTTIALFGWRIPIVVSLMGSDTESGTAERKLICFMNRFCWSGLIVKSKSMFDRLKIKDAYIIPNGVNIKTIDKNFREKNPHPEIFKVIFAADPFRKSKNFQLAEKAFQYLKNEQMELKVMFDLPHDQIIGELFLADIVLLTSLWEGSPNIVKEAMACNSPVVSTNVGDVEWLFGVTNGYFLTTFDPRNVAKKLLEAKKFVMEQGRTQGRDRILNLGLDSHSIASKLIHFYTKIIGAN